MDRFITMATFVRVAELGSLSAAARELGLTQPAVSQQVAALERRLGVRLLNRSTRRLALTEAGERYHIQARRILEAVTEVEDGVTEAAGTLSGILRVHAPVGFGQAHVAPILIGFQRLHPKLAVELITDDRYADLIGEAVDVAIRLGTLASPGLVARRLAMLRRILVASPEYVAVEGCPQTPEDLARHPHVRFSWSAAGDVLSLNGPDGPLEVRVRSRFLANNTFVLVEAIRAGIGVGGAQVPLVQPLLENGALVRVMEDYAYAPLELHAIYPSGRFVPRRVRAFVDHLAAALPTIPGLERE
ncbi:DNA-binding transcriptional LysR family regulator [Bradyrhizobium sp. USDA 4518]|uniref:LysR family transcriptional regulator n=1 Tax=Bradyrhizobium brasilense TaxID=1419277 RepID=UPI00145641BA|nr:LysR family transcriptional regulator [Bradyrhizobium brasilense]NLS71641.1 LysR family transcriptional regulator [Bradyrhizobium brasilense]